MVVSSAFFVAAPPILLASFIVSASNIHDVGWISIGRHPIYWCRYYCRRRSFDCCSTSNNNANDNEDDDDDVDDDNDNDSSSNNNVYDDDAEYMADAVLNDVVRISSFIFS